MKSPICTCLGTTDESNRFPIVKDNFEEIEEIDYNTFDNLQPSLPPDVFKLIYFTDNQQSPHASIASSYLHSSSSDPHLLSASSKSHFLCCGSSNQCFNKAGIEIHYSSNSGSVLSPPPSPGYTNDMYTRIDSDIDILPSFTRFSKDDPFLAPVYDLGPSCGSPQEICHMVDDECFLQKQETSQLMNSIVSKSLENSSSNEYDSESSGQDQITDQKYVYSSNLTSLFPISQSNFDSNSLLYTPHSSGQISPVDEKYEDSPQSLLENQLPDFEKIQTPFQQRNYRPPSPQNKNTQESSVLNNNSKERRKPGRKPGQVSNVLHLWQFMRDLLYDPHYGGRIIEWISKSEGVFKVTNSSEVARLWGEKKNNKKKMTYEKMSRSLRYSRLEGYFADLPKDKNYPKKLCFKFGNKAKEYGLYEN